MNRSKNDRKYLQVGLIVVSLICVAAVVIATIIGNTDKHIYDEAKTIELHSKDGELIIAERHGETGDVIAKISVCEVKSGICTDGKLVDWYENYVQKQGNDYFYHIVKYTDRAGGIYCVKDGGITKDVILKENEEYPDQWEIDAAETGTTYFVRDGSLSQQTSNSYSGRQTDD